jgi:acetylornithine deacetylase/succinyl-diaminopimelate desuccinylase-like protein
MTRADAVALAHGYLQSGEFLRELDRRVAYPTESQNPERRDCLRAYLEAELQPAFSQLGFSTRLIESPKGRHPYLLADYREDATRPTVLMYGHGDVVDGMIGQWRDGLDPWQTRTSGNRVYGRGTADNKGQHSINLAALRAVREARGGRLGFNAKFIIETGEEIGSPDLREVCESLRDDLKADLFLASDGPRLAADRPTIFLGCRGGIRIHLDVNLREGSHHSGNWGGVLANPATILANAIATLVDAQGRLLLDKLKPPRLSNQIRSALADVKIEPMPDEPALSEDWVRRVSRRPSGFMPGIRSKCWRYRRAISKNRPTRFQGRREPCCSSALLSALNLKGLSMRSGRGCGPAGFRWSR